MLTTPHLLVGAAIGASLGPEKSLLVVPVAGASHFVFDWIPHLMGFIEVEDLDKKDVLFVVGDVLLGVGLLMVLSLGNTNWEILWIGALASVLPDFHHLVKVIFGPETLKKYTKAHLKFHYQKEMNVITGMSTQIITCVIATATILLKK
ncbi:MAG: hypothetical protein Q8P13_00990 [bacterium]|nr:hypothetical protein [bacterium]